MGDRAFNHTGGRDRNGAKNADRLVNTMGNEGAGGDHAAVPRGRDQRDFRHALGGDITQIHQGASLQTDSLHSRLERRIRLQSFGRLIARHAKISRPHDNHRHAVVNQGDLDAVDLVNGGARGQERAARGSGHIQKIDRNGGGGSRHAVNARLAFIFHLAAGRLDMGDGNAGGVEHVDADRRDAVLGIDQAVLDGVGADSGQKIAAVLLVGDEALFREDLQEQIVDIRIRMLRPRDDRNL